MKWVRNGYEVVATAFDNDLYHFVVAQDGEPVHTITPWDLDNQDRIIADLNAGGDVNGWEDGMGGTITI
ncbi:helix-turn-helix domain-containing protein [Paenibacillus jiagnxiensis]|uniref:helix-turn-helix domain-containing protein n=1 Tax=Paenibacillus jiagnxiensis TaxID=3228926 RepID=UPI0033B496EC